MDVESTLTGPISYLLMVWGVITAVFVILLVRRTVLTNHEDDQIFLDPCQDHMAREQRELVAKINGLTKPLATTGITSGALLLLIAGMWVYHGLKNF